MIAPLEPTLTEEMRPHFTACVLLLRSLLSYARERGVDVDRLLHQLEIPMPLLDDADARVPETALQRAWEEIASATHDDAVGIDFAEHARKDEFGVLDYAMYFSSTLRDAIDRIARFYRLLSDAAAIEVVSDGDATHIRRLVRATHPLEQDAFFALICLRLCDLSDRAVRPREVRFEHPPRAEAKLAELFRCRIRFGQRTSQLIFATADLALPAHAAKPKLAALLDRYASELLARLPSTASYADHVRQAIVRAIQRGPPTVAAVARQMRSSPRTVQRRLAEAETTHKELVDEVRRQLAVRYLESSKLSITEIAYLLGYRDSGSFRRSFKRWTGKTPVEVRAG